MSLHREAEWVALQLLSKCRVALVEVDLPVCRRALDDRFSLAWFDLLLERAENQPRVKDPERVVASWLKKRGWQQQVLFMLATRIGLFEESDGVRFNEMRKLRRKGFEPWLLAALWNAAQREGIRNPVAYLATLLKDESWVQFYERVEFEALARHVTPQAITSIVRTTLRAMQKKQARSVGSSPTPDQQAQGGATPPDSNAPRQSR